MSSIAFGGIEESLIRAQLQRVTRSDLFSRSRRLSGLLIYLVEESLAGRADKIKATSIAIDVFGRGENFDQQRDPIVRVEAGRLRERLKDYYQGPGRADSLRIEIPKGAYRPVFEIWQDDEASSVDAFSTGPAQALRDRGLGIAITAIAVLLVIVAILSYQIYLGSKPTPGSASEFVPPDPVGKPYLVVMPVAAHTGDRHSERLAMGLVESLITHLSKLSGLSVMAHASVLEARDGNQPYSITDFRSEFGVTHLLRCTVETDRDSVMLNVQLVDARTAAVLWAERLSRPLDEVIDLEETLALAVVSELAVQLQPGERARLAHHHATSAESWLFYRQGLVTIMPPRDIVRVEAARRLFRRAIELDPSFAGAYAGLSFSHSTQVLFMNSAVPAQERERAIRFARQAIELDEDFASGHAVLAFAQMQGDKLDLAVSSARRAIAIQPGDAFSHFILGMTLMVTGQAEDSIAHLQEALRLDPLEIRMPYLNLLGQAYYLAGDYSNALRTIEYNYQKGGPRGPHMDVFIAAANAQLGEMSRARETVAEMLGRYPDFPYEEWLHRWIVDEKLLTRSMELLETSGLQWGS